jgi:hypothetical protein
MVQAGIGYLETVVENYVQDYGCTGFGRGWDSSGFISYYGSGYGQDDLQWNETNLLNAGFTKKNEFTENGVQHIIYEREEWGGYQSFKLYARLSMVGDFLQIEFGYGTRTDMHDD